MSPPFHLSNVFEGGKKKKLYRTDFTVTDARVDISLLEVDTLMCPLRVINISFNTLFP